MPGPLTPRRRRGIEYIDLPDTDPRARERSLADVARSNTLFGGRSAVLAELRDALRGLSGHVTLLDVGTGVGDIPAHAARVAARRGVALTTIGLDCAPELACASRARVSACVCADARALPFADASVDVVTCSQVLHHFPEDEAVTLVREMTRVARHRVIVSDIRRSWLAAAGIWLASFPLRFHPISRHDGVVSVLRGFTTADLGRIVRAGAGAAGARATVRNRRGFRVTAAWRPRREET